MAERHVVERDLDIGLGSGSHARLLMADPKDLLAAERTLLAWIRTGIALMGLGFIVARFGLFLRELARAGGHSPSQSLDSSPIGLLVVVSGIAVNVWASVRHHFIVRRLRAGERDISSTGPVVIGIVSGIGGVLLIAVLAGALR